MKKALFVLALGMFSTIAIAANTARAPITTITYSEGGNLYFTTSAPTINPAGCDAASYLIASTNPRIKNYYAMLLTADASNQKVLIQISDSQCIDLAGTTYPRVILIQMST